MQPGAEAQSVIVQLLYDIQSNIVTHMEGRNQTSTQIQLAVNSFLKKFFDYQFNSSECALYPAVLKLMQGLNFPCP